MVGLLEYWNWDWGLKLTAFGLYQNESGRGMGNVIELGISGEINLPSTPYYAKATTHNLKPNPREWP